MNPYKSFSWLADLISAFFDFFRESERERELSVGLDLYLHTCGSNWRSLYYACMDCPRDHPMRRLAIEHLMRISDHPARLEQARKLLEPEPSPQTQAPAGFTEQDPDHWKW